MQKLDLKHLGNVKNVQIYLLSFYRDVFIKLYVVVSACCWFGC